MPVPTCIMKLGLRCGVDWNMPPPWMARAIELEIEDIQTVIDDLYAAWCSYSDRHPKHHMRAWERYTRMHSALHQRRLALIHDFGTLKNMIDLNKRIGEHT